MEKIRLIAVVGPTASGKTALSVEIAKWIGGVIISADSMQIYKDMPIASAAPTKSEQQGVEHKLVEFLPRESKFTVADYVSLASAEIENAVSNKKQPILVGGTGLYVDSLVNNISFAEEGDNSEVRARLMREADEFGLKEILCRLQKIDPEYAAKLHENDKKRIVRGLEVFELHGKNVTELNELSRQKPSPYDTTFIGICYRDREKLYDRINRRVDIMLKNGLLDEAKSAYELSDKSTSVQAIGHKDFFPYFEGKITLDEATENLKRETRRYAKRQMTWFNKNENINWIFADETDDLLGEAKKILIKNNY